MKLLIGKEVNMKRCILAILLIVLIPWGTVMAQDFTGNYVARVEGEIITLNLVQHPDGRVTGKMSLEGLAYTINAQKKGDQIAGVMTTRDDSEKFSAKLKDNALLVTFFDTEEGQRAAASEEVVFARMDQKAVKGQGTTAAAPETENAAGNDKVIINGVVLSKVQLTEFEQRYRIKPRPGDYWYDSRSGLYGVVGFQAYGFMMPGHSFGELRQTASNGNTGVFVNGRELPQTEWLVWSQLLGYVIQPGRYWLAANGDAGYEGNPTPTDNLYLAARRTAYRGSGGGGDNLWSTRFSAGNYDSGGQRGYVSVPGYGPVGYGF